MGRAQKEQPTVSKQLQLMLIIETAWEKCAQPVLVMYLYCGLIEHFNLWGCQFHKD